MIRFSLDPYAVRVAEKIVSNYPNTFLVQVILFSLEDFIRYYYYNKQLMGRWSGSL